MLVGLPVGAVVGVTVGLALGLKRGLDVGVTVFQNDQNSHSQQFLSDAHTTRFDSGSQSRSC